MLGHSDLNARHLTACSCKYLLSYHFFSLSVRLCLKFCEEIFLSSMSLISWTLMWAVVVLTPVERLLLQKGREDCSFGNTVLCSNYGKRNVVNILVSLSASTWGISNKHFRVLETIIEDHFSRIDWRTEAKNCINVS